MSLKISTSRRGTYWRRELIRGGGGLLERLRYLRPLLNEKFLLKFIGRFPFARSDQSVLMERTSYLTRSGQNGPAHGLEPLSSPAPVGQSVGIYRVVAGKDVCTHLRLFQNGQMDRNQKRHQFKLP